MSEILVIEGLAKSYGDWQLRDVSFTVHAGSLVALTGHNGSGKSTILRCIAGLTSYAGTISVMGHGPGIDAARHLAYVPQSVQLPPSATIGETLDLFASIRGADVDGLPLPDGFLRPWDSRIGTLSGGHRQRVALAVALLGDPALLLLDEPVSNLDEAGREAFWTVLANARERGVSALVAAPALSTGVASADRTIALHEGQTVHDERSDGGGGGSHDSDDAVVRQLRRNAP